MEGLPRMPMLSVELKFSPASSDFGPKFAEYVSRVYQENPDAYSKEFEELNQLRDNAIKAPADFTGCSTLKKYFAQLFLLRNRFPMEENDAAAVPFTWYEKFSDMPSPATYEDIRYELACILHNIGAVHSYLATVDSRLTSDGMKVSCTHFQCAAWAFQMMRDNTEPFRFSSSSFSPDFDHNIMDWYAVLMLAQAQECILEKSLVDNRKAHIIAKVAIQVAEFYAQAIRILEQPSVSDIVGSSKCRSWRKFVDMKRRFYRAIAYYELGTQSDEQQKMGERLAYFQAASTELTEAMKLGHKDSSETTHQSLQFAEDVIVARLNQAKKENDFIYHEKIPSMESLPELKGASLVKAIPFDPLDADVSGGDIFKRLIPLEVHRTSSVYSEEKAKLLRRISEQAETKDSALEEFVASLKVDQLMLDVDFYQLPLPETLIERCAAFNAKPSAVSDLLGQMSKLTNSYEEVESTILEIEKKLNQSDKEAKNVLIQMYGTGEENPGSTLPNDVRASIVVRLKSFRDEFDRYRRAHEQATKANAELHKALSAHSENLNLLSLPLAELKKQLPLPPDNMNELPETVEMKRLLAKVDEMKRQRDMLMEQLRQQLRDDDVTKVLLAAKDKDEQEVFDKEIKKHEKQVSVIEQNLAAQENIIKAVTEANAKYSDIRKQVTTSNKQRDARIRSLVASYDVYSDLDTKAKQGIEFYEKLTKSLKELETALSTWCETDFDKFCSKSKMELDKRAAAVSEARKIATSSTSAASSINEPPGPKLKDYMAYYRAKKAGQTAAFPPPGGATVYPTTLAAGSYSVSQADSNFPMAGTNGIFPMASTNGAVPIVSNGANVAFPPSSFPVCTISGAYPTPGSVGAYSTPGPAVQYSLGGTGGHMPMSGGPIATSASSGQMYATPGVSGSYAMPTASGLGATMAAPSTRPEGYYLPNAVSGSTVSGSAMPNYATGTSMATMNPIPNMMNNVIPQSTAASTHCALPPATMANMPAAPVFHAPGIPSQMAPPTTFAYNSIYLEPVAFGSNYVQLRWRYDGPKPVKYMITFRGYQRYDAGMGRIEEREVDTGAPVKLDAEHYIVHNLHPDTIYAFEVSVIDEASGRIFVRSPTVRVTTNSSLL